MTSKLEQLQDILTPVIEALGYRCWGIEYISQGRHSVLRVYIDHEKGIVIEDCETVSRQLTKLKQANHIDLPDRRTVLIRDRRRLEQIAGSA